METFLGMELTVPLRMFIISQIFGLLTMVFDGLSYQIKDKRKYLLVFTIGSVWWTGMFWALNQFILTLVAAFSIAQSMAFWWVFSKDNKKHHIAGIAVLIISLVVGLVFAVISLSHAETPLLKLYSIFVLVTSLAFVVGQYLPGKHFVRFTAFFYAIAVIMLTYAESNGTNIMGVLIEAAKIFSIIIFYVVIIKRRYRTNRLRKIKATVQIQIDKVKHHNSDKVMPYDKLERLLAKMIRYEIALLKREHITNLQEIEKANAKMKEDMEIIKDYEEATKEDKE
ncbi:MAG: YgjV family protein [Spirochaetaceae bacterium]|nr:YgjV family protein [Spirochaetaceae bacterium]